MSSLYIREYTSMAKIQSSKGDISAPQEPGTDQTKVAYTGTAGQSAAFAESTRFIGITSDGIFSYLIGDNPTATTNAFRVPIGTIVYLGVIPGQKISAITNT